MGVSSQVAHFNTGGQESLIESVYSLWRKRWEYSRYSLAIWRLGAQRIAVMRKGVQDDFYATPILICILFWIISPLEHIVHYHISGFKNSEIANFATSNIGTYIQASCSKCITCFPGRALTAGKRKNNMTSWIDSSKAPPLLSDASYRQEDCRLVTCMISKIIQRHEVLTYKSSCSWSL
jgi:hypothetical protein